MEKIYGSTTRQDGLQKIGRRKYMVFYGLYTDERGAKYEYRQTYDHHPTWEEVRSSIVAAINEHTKERILTGMEWDEKRIWLSEENQRNFMMIENLTWSSFPLRVKINEDEYGDPIYLTFESPETFAIFSKAITQHVMGALTTGWEEKDGLKPETYGFTKEQ